MLGCCYSYLTHCSEDRIVAMVFAVIASNTLLAENSAYWFLLIVSLHHPYSKQASCKLTGRLFCYRWSLCSGLVAGRGYGVAICLFEVWVNTMWHTFKRFLRTKRKSLLSLLGIGLLAVVAVPLGHLGLTKFNEPATLVGATALGYSNDASHLNQTRVRQVVAVKADKAAMQEQIRDLLKYAQTHHLKVSVAGAQHSMGGHTIYPDGIVLNMLPYKHMVFNEHSNVLTIGSGALWADALALLDAKGKSVAVMQSFSDFSVGGSLSVNGHGWQKNAPPLSSSVLGFELMQADGSVVYCSRTENAPLFHAVIGGYGLFGVILDVDIKVVDNVSLRFHSEAVTPENYAAQYEYLVTHNPHAQLAYGRLRISDKHFLEEATLNYFENQYEPPPPLAQQQANNKELKRLVFRGSVDSEYGKRLRWDLEQGLNTVQQNTLFTRNELLAERASLIDNKDPRRTDLLQEYFVPKHALAGFVADIKPILKHSDIDLLNITIREVKQDHDANLNYAREDVFGLVFLFSQQKTPTQEAAMAKLNNDLLDVALRHGGTFYLPYRLHIGKAKMRLAYPQADGFFALKREYDPNELFSNRFYQHYR